MKFQFLVEIDLKTLCHRRDENCDADVLNDREACAVLRDWLAFVVDEATYEAGMTDVMYQANVEGVSVRPTDNQPESNEQ